MKKCFKCNLEKPLTEFYKHKKMSDGRVNKCKECNKKDVKLNYLKKSKDEEYVIKERQRTREKYHRLNYKEKYKQSIEYKPWKKSSILKNLNKILKIEKGYEAHHWSYNDEHFMDVIILPIKIHRRLHTLIELDMDKKKYRIKDTEELLNTREQHEEFIKNKLNQLKKQI